jgi:hypothetical protein
MLNNDRKRIVRHRLLPENTTDKQGNPLSLKSFVTFVPFKVNCVARDGPPEEPLGMSHSSPSAVGHVVRNSG